MSSIYVQDHNFGARGMKNMIRDPWYVLVLLLTNSAIQASLSATQWSPCIEIRRDIRIPCKCSISREYPQALEMNCDRVVLTPDFPESLQAYPIIAFSHRHNGHRSLPGDLLGLNLTLLRLDLSSNSIHGLMDRLLFRQSNLRELRLADNLLGDSLNPIFSSNEFHDLRELKLLDLRRNGLRGIEEGILKGCYNLEELYLDGNNLTGVPDASLKGPKALRILSISRNNIGILVRNSFPSLGNTLIRLDISDNELAHIEEGALSGLDNLLFLNISHNDLNRFNSDVFKGVHSLLQLDLSANILQEFPTDALRHLTELKFLNISNNLISGIERTDLSSLNEIQVLDLSRNNIGRLGVNAFSNLSALTRLDLSLNALRTIEESSFEGLTNLKWLSLQDNNILLIPSPALTRLPSLVHLHIEYNRIAALSAELIRLASSNLITLGLRGNLVREIPARLFLTFENLLGMDLSGNMLISISSSTFEGLEDTLLSLDLSNNRLQSIVGELPLKSLISLNLSNNQLRGISPETFQRLPRLQYLNLSMNSLYGGFPPVFPSSLITLDVSKTDLRILPTVLFLNLDSLENIYMGGNSLKQIDEGTFQHLYNLTTIDLSHNLIEHIANSAFVGLINLFELILRNNKLTSFVGEHFSTGTGLEILDLSRNQIAHLSPTAFVIHPRLREIDLSYNEFIQFPSEFVKPLQFLEVLNLSNNLFKTVDEFAFAQMGRLRTLLLSGNMIESVDELAFHNSTQLQILDLSENHLESLSERAFEGLLRLEKLDFHKNQLKSLPETIFDSSRIRSVERIDLSSNKFNEIPIKALQKQSTSLLSLNIARNRLIEVFTQDIVNNVKELDLSENPLSENAVNGILGEAKILRTLNLARTGIKDVKRLEMPFLTRLNLSNNYIWDIRPSILERSTMLENLDLSKNKFIDFVDLKNTLKTLPSLQTLDLSGNNVKTINESSFDGMNSLRSLKIMNLVNCTRIEKNAFKNLDKLKLLHAYGYPRLGYFDIPGIIKEMYNLESLDVEMKDSSVGNEQLSLGDHPRLRELILRGERLRTILSSSLVGVRNPYFSIGLKNTSIETVTAALFFPVPRSTRVELDVTDSRFSTLTALLLSVLDERSGKIQLRGLNKNPIRCDCESKPFYRWLRSSLNKFHSQIICKTPAWLSGKSLTNLTEDQLSCENMKSTTISFTSPSTSFSSTFLSSIPSSTTSRISTSSEPEIIWTVAPNVQQNRNNKNYNKGQDMVRGASVPIGNNIITSNDDTLIIGIVGCVVAFIAVMVIIVCICRFRGGSQMNDQDARMAAAMANSSIHEASILRPTSAYSGKINHDIYHVGSYNGSTLGRAGNGIVSTTPVQVMPYMQPMHLMHPPTVASNGQQLYGYYDVPPGLPMYLTCQSENNNKFPE